MALLLGDWRTDGGLTMHDGRFGITAAEVPVADPPSVLANDGLTGSGEFTPVLQSLPAGAVEFAFDDDGSFYYVGPASSFTYLLYEDGDPVGSPVTVTLAEALENQPPVYTGSLAAVAGIVGSPFPAIDIGSGFSDPEAGPLVFAKVGTWPASITLSAAGVTGGTFPAVGSYALQVQATDDGGLPALSAVLAVTSSVLPISGNIGVKSGGVYADPAGIYVKSGGAYVSTQVYVKSGGAYQRIA